MIQYLGDSRLYSSIYAFDLRTNNELKEKFSAHQELQKVGTIFDFLRSGEWIWQQYKEIMKYQNMERFDYTFLVANHFKALELYLCKKIADSCSGDVLNDKRIGNVAYFTTTTLGNYHYYLNEKSTIRAYNYDPFKKNVPYDRKKTLVHILREWKDNCRNAYQHKDIITAVEEANFIREKTKTLFNLIEELLK